MVDTGSGKLKFVGIFCRHYSCCLRVLIMDGRFDIRTGKEHKCNDVNRRESVGDE